MRQVKKFIVIMTFPDDGNTFEKYQLKDLIQEDVNRCDSDSFVTVEVLDAI